MPSRVPSSLPSGLACSLPGLPSTPPSKLLSNLPCKSAQRSAQPPARRSAQQCRHGSAQRSAQRTALHRTLHSAQHPVSSLPSSLPIVHAVLRPAACSAVYQQDCPVCHAICRDICPAGGSTVCVAFRFAVLPGSLADGLPSSTQVCPAVFPESCFKSSPATFQTTSPSSLPAVCPAGC